MKPTNLCPVRKAECNCWSGKACGFAVVEGRGKCRLVDEVVGLGEDYVSPFAGEGEEE